MAERWTVEVFHGEFRASRWQAFSGLHTVRAALDAVPDPVSGLPAGPGRGGGTAPAPRRPQPTAGAVDLRESLGAGPPDVAGLEPACAAHPGGPAQLSPTA